MPDPTSAKTSISLLKRLELRPTDEVAWEEFVDRYGRRIVGWCRFWGLQDSDAADVTQTVLLKISANIGNFDPARGSFRAVHGGRMPLDREGPNASARERRECDRKGESLST